ncbi:DUF6920 family protein [Undibacterium crateris]|uniref:DUF6920 family protein n=1 Tax=Undibacterium crateris TaxID=2528175 RepID=UPI001389E0CF|nr:DUF6544 family protein [Undibacterium crateris]NDI84087.1 hypothetical protein [Undibacterium crateris]
MIILLCMVSALAIAVLTGTALWYRGVWRSASNFDREKMGRAGCSDACNAYDAREIQALPPPVKRYFEAALRDGQPLILQLTFLQQGQFRLNLKSRLWRPFHATQCVAVSPPGFDWDARIRCAPGLDIWVRDAYVLGAGHLKAALAGLFNLSDQHDRPELARGELMRYLAEAVWYPTALLPSQGVQWRALDDTSAEATIHDGGTAVTLVFTFGADALVSTVRAASRPLSATQSAPWLCRIHAYIQCHGMSIPLHAEVEWELPDGSAPYFVGHVSELAYSFCAIAPAIAVSPVQPGKN